jgi:hypothetical protein
MPRVRLLRLVARLVARLIIDYFAYAARPGASARRGARHAARRRLLHLAQTRRRLLRPRRASGCFGTSCGSLRGSLSTTSPRPRVRVPRLIARLVVDYFGYAARPSALERRAAHHQLLHPLCSFGCFGSSCNLSHDSSSTTSPHAVARLIVDYFASCRLVVDYFEYAAGPGASARRAARHAARHRLLHLAQAARRLLRLQRASGCFGTSRGSSRGSLSTTSPPSRVQVPRLITKLVVDYFDYAARPGPSARHAARRQLLHLLRASGCFG